MSISLSDYAKQNSSNVDDNFKKNVGEQYAKLQSLSQEQLTKMFFDLAAEEKKNGNSSNMMNTISHLRTMLNSDQQKILDTLLKGLE